MRRTLLSLVALTAPLTTALACTPSNPPGTICRPKTEGELQEIARGDRTCDTVEVRETTLVNLGGLRGLEMLWGGVLVFSNPVLEDLGGLEDLKSVGGINIIENSALGHATATWPGEVSEIVFGGNDLTGLTLTLRADFDTLRVRDEPLTTLELIGAETMTTLALSRLPELATLDGLAAVRSIEVLELIDLPSLSADTVEALLARLDPAPSILEICGVAGYPGC